MCGNLFATKAYDRSNAFSGAGADKGREHG
jgi:hypothetical protein